MKPSARPIPSIREEMKERLPRWSQPFLTWLTGRAHHGQKPIWSSTSFSQTLSAFTCLYGGAFAVYFSLHQGGWLPWMVIPIAWIFMAGAARKIQVTLVHQCAHNNFSGSRKLDRWFAEVFGSLILVDNFDNYIYEHVRIHHTKKLGSEVDPDCRFLLQLGFTPDKSKKQLWSQLFRTLVSPHYHLGFIKARLKANFVTAPLQRKLISASITFIALSLIIKFSLWTSFLFGWLLPLFFFYHMAALLNFSSLHFWLKEVDENLKSKQKLCMFTAGRFLGETLPLKELTGIRKYFAWTRWCFRMFFIHLPSRLGVLSGDLPVHDYHHRHPHCSDWANYLYTRQWDIDSGLVGWSEPYEENWGLKNCIDAVFTSMTTSKIEIDQSSYKQTEDMPAVALSG